MAKDPDIFEARLNVQQGYLSRLESIATKILNAPAFEIADYEPQQFQAYASEKEVEKILADIKKRNAERDIRIVGYAIAMARAATDLIDAQMAYHVVSGKIITPKASLSIHEDEKTFAGLMTKVQGRVEAMEGTNPKFEAQKIREVMGVVTAHYLKVVGEAAAPTAASLSLPELSRKIYEHRSKCVESVFEINEIRMYTLDAEIDCVAILRKSVDEGIMPSSPDIDNVIHDHQNNILGDIYMAHETLSSLKDFLKELSKTGSYDMATGDFDAHRHKPLTIRPLINYIP